MNPGIGGLNFFYNITDVRNELKAKTIRTYDSGAPLNLYKLTSPTDCYKGLFRHCRSLDMMRDTYLELHSDTQGWMKIKDELLVPDIDAVGFFAAFYAWTVISDEDRWENTEIESRHTKALIKENPDKFKNLNYGLITKYYQPIYRSAQYAADWTTLEEDMDMPASVLEAVNNEIMPHIYKWFSHIPKAKVDAEIDKLCMSVSSEDYY